MKNKFGMAPAAGAAGKPDRAGPIGIGPRNSGIARPYLLAGVAAILAVALYAVIGGPNVVTYAPRGAAQAVGDSGEAGTKLPSVGNLLDGLKAKLEKNPNDGDGWLLLAKSYQHLGRLQEARDAYANAVANGSSETSFESLLSTSSNTDIDTDTAGIAKRWEARCRPMPAFSSPQNQVTARRCRWQLSAGPSPTSRSTSN